MLRSFYDAIIVGGGPAGLSAALVLGRCRRRVLVCDDGRPRNAAAQRLHGFITHDGVSPRELRDLARQDGARYGVQFL
jgi:thioredoxin reductase